MDRPTKGLATVLAVISISTTIICSTYGNKAFAQNPSSTARQRCITTVVDTLASRQEIASPRSITRFCACALNRQSKGLLIDDCPRMSTVTIRQMKEVFNGDY